VIRAMFRALPLFNLFVARRKHPPPQPDGLVAIRLIFLGNFIPLFLFGVLLSLQIRLRHWFASSEGDWFALLVIAAGLGSQLGIRWLLRRPLDVSTPLALIGEWRGRLFIGMGLSSAPALIAFIATFLTGTLWIYLLGLFFAVLGFLTIGPTRKNLTQLQERIREQGSPLSLVAVLRHPPPGDGSSVRRG
jgi:hypothetical protein